MTPTRADLEREILSLQDRLSVALEAVGSAKSLVVGWTREDAKRAKPYQRLLAMVESVSRERPMAKPLLARLGWQQGMVEASAIIAEVGRLSTEPEWRAACERAAQEIQRKLG